MKPWLPLLYFCAEALLAGKRNATAFNERLHSPAALIFSAQQPQARNDRVPYSRAFLRQGARQGSPLAGTATDYKREMLADSSLRKELIISVRSEDD